MNESAQLRAPRALGFYLPLALALHDPVLCMPRALLALVLYMTCDLRSLLSHMSLFPHVLSVPPTLRTQCANLTFCAIEFPCLMLLLSVNFLLVVFCSRSYFSVHILRVVFWGEFT